MALLKMPMNIWRRSNPTAQRNLSESIMIWHSLVKHWLQSIQTARWSLTMSRRSLEIFIHRMRFCFVSDWNSKIYWVVLTQKMHSHSNRCRNFSAAVICPDVKPFLTKLQSRNMWEFRWLQSRDRYLVWDWHWIARKFILYLWRDCLQRIIFVESFSSFYRNPPMEL